MERGGGGAEEEEREVPEEDGGDEVEADRGPREELGVGVAGPVVRDCGHGVSALVDADRDSSRDAVLVQEWASVPGVAGGCRVAAQDKDRGLAVLPRRIVEVQGETQ